MTKNHDFQYYLNLLENFLTIEQINTETWNGKIIRKKNVILYRWWTEIRNGRRKITQDQKKKLLEKNLFLKDMVAPYVSKTFNEWLHIMEDYLQTVYYYGCKNNRTDKKHITTWDGKLKKNSGNHKNNNLYEWYRRIRQDKIKLSNDEKKILTDIGLNLKRTLINKRLSFDDWIEIIKEYKKENGGECWDGIICTKAKNFKNRNLYEYINSLRDKTLSNEQKQKLKNLNIKTILERKKNII